MVYLNHHLVLFVGCLMSHQHASVSLANLRVDMEGVSLQTTPVDLVDCLYGRCI